MPWIRRRSRSRRSRLSRWLSVRRLYVQVAFIAFIAYTGIFIFLSAAGSWRIAGQIAQWEPYETSFYLRRTEEQKLIIRGSFFGFLFAPLTLLDRALVHPSHPSDSEEGRIAAEHEEQRLRERIDEVVRQMP